MNIRFSSKQIFQLAGWSAYLSAAAMIISIVFTGIVFSKGIVVPGTRTHNPLIEVFDVSAALFLIPLPIALDRLYRTTAPTLSRLAMLNGVAVGMAGTILSLLFVFEVLWFVDVFAEFLYGLLAFSLWMLLEAFLASQSRKPPGGFVMTLLSATIIGYPLWAIWLGHVFLSTKSG
jgi:hypothetical protein